MDSETESQTKWEGEVSMELKGANADEIWSLFADFCNLHKWFPLDTCYQVEPISGDTSLVRYCAKVSAGDSSVKWAKERLLLMDPIKRVLTYEVLENNVGFESYVATVTVSPVGGEEGAGCRIVWSFVSDPIQGWGFEDLLKYFEFCLLHMAEKTGNSVQKIG